MRAPALFVSLLVSVLVLAPVIACGGDSDDDDGNRDPDASGGAIADAATPADAAPPDASPADAGAIDAGGLPLSGFGALAGDCDVIDDEITDPFPSLFESAIAFDHPFTDEEASALTDGGREMLADGNAGGSSLLSEVFAFELLARCELTPLVKTETEIEYDAPGAITDLLVAIDGEKIGVSVTRAVAFPFDAPYTVEQASELLTRKLSDILESTNNVSEGDRWRKQILAVLAFGPDHVTSLTAALAEIDPAIRADTIVWILVTDGTDDFIYCDGPCR